MNRRDNRLCRHQHLAVVQLDTARHAPGVDDSFHVAAASKFAAVVFNAANHRIPQFNGAAHHTTGRVVVRGVDQEQQRHACRFFFRAATHLGHPLEKVQAHLGMFKALDHQIVGAAHHRHQHFFTQRRLFQERDETTEGYRRLGHAHRYHWPELFHHQRHLAIGIRVLWRETRNLGTGAIQIEITGEVVAIVKHRHEAGVGKGKLQTELCLEAKFVVLQQRMALQMNDGGGMGIVNKAGEREGCRCLATAGDRMLFQHQYAEAACREIGGGR